ALGCLVLAMVSCLSLALVSYRLAARSCVTLWRYSNLFQPLFFSTLFGCLDRHAGHDRASYFFCLAREQPATRKQLTLSSAISGILQFCIISCRYPLLDCIIPYTNYYLPLGALAAAGLIEEILRLTG